MKKVIPLLFLFSFTLTLLGEDTSLQNEDRLKHYNLKKKNLAIKGYDPVSYFTGNPEKGTAEHTFSYKGLQYYFTSEESLKAFKENPDKYEPAFGGWCAFAMLDGDKVDINPKRYKIIEGKNYLFYDAFLSNTLKEWNERAEKTSDEQLVERAEDRWEGLVSEE